MVHTDNSHFRRFDPATTENRRSDFGNCLRLVFDHSHISLENAQEKVRKNESVYICSLDGPGRRIRVVTHNDGRGRNDYCQQIYE